MLTSKQRAALRSQANQLETILQVGKGGLGEAFYRQVDDALEAREMIKIRVLDTSPQSAGEAAQEIARAVPCEVVQVMGSRITLYRRDFKEPKFTLVK